MSEIKEGETLDLEQDETYQERSWVVERIGWVVVALILLAGLAGFMGTGVVSSATVTDSSGLLKVEYNRFMRKHNPDNLKFEIATSAVGPDQKVRLWLSQDYLEDFQLNQITPEPESVESSGDRITYVFSISQPTKPLQIAFYFEPEHFGTLSGQAGLSDKGSVQFDQWVYP